jgi:hypothetical protein
MDIKAGPLKLGSFASVCPLGARLRFPEQKCQKKVDPVPLYEGENSSSAQTESGTAKLLWAKSEFAQSNRITIRTW